ncbi:MAG: hypothetical protein ACRDK9_12000 [Solirubrobacterales bacterium]
MRLKLALLIATVALAVPAAAHAGVGSELRKADNAVERAVAAAHAGDGGAVADAIGAAERRTQKAKRIAKRTDGRGARAKALRKVAARSDRGLGTFATLIPVVPPQVQGLMVDGAASYAAIHEQVVDLLVSLAQQLPQPAQAAVLEAIAQFEADGDIEALLAALASPDVLAEVKPLISDLIAQVTEHVTGVLDQVQELLATLPLPPEAAAAIAAAFDQVEATLGQVFAMVESLLDGLLGGELAGILGPGVVCDLLGGLPLPIPLPICAP